MDEAQFSNFNHSYCSLHFCFYSDKSFNLFEIANTAENIFSYLVLNYSFSNKLNNYPYRFIVYESSYNATLQENQTIIFSTSSCDVVVSVVYGMVSDIFGQAEKLYPWLYYGFCEYLVSHFCSDKRSYYLGILNSNSNLIPLEQLFYISPSTLEKSKLDIYYANTSSFVSYLIDKYSSYRFSVFLESLLKSGDVKNASILAFGKDITQP
ncbi:MAG: hypothetical protein ACP5IO_03915 [Elusimicrobiales bacterium]